MISRGCSVPERLGMFGMGVAVVIPILPMIDRMTGVHPFCPLRALTSMPCPFCGLTTAASELMSGHIVAAIVANPGILGIVGVMAVGTVALVLRLGGVIDPPTPWSVGARRKTERSVYLVVFIIWMYQLHRCWYL